MKNNMSFEYNLATIILRNMLLKKLLTEEEYEKIDTKNKKSFLKN